jgi:hypothetical protein
MPNDGTQIKVSDRYVRTSIRFLDGHEEELIIDIKRNLTEVESKTFKEEV